MEYSHTTTVKDVEYKTALLVFTTSTDTYNEN